VVGLASIRQTFDTERSMEHLDVSTTVGALAQCRQTVLRRAHELIGDESAADAAGSDGAAGVSGLLMASLEELKVAEEELRLQNAQLADSRAREDRELYHYRQLFTYSSAAALLTDRYGTILEANRAASALFRREAKHLAGKPIEALLEPRARERFRREFARIGADSEITDWRIVLHRVGDLPIEVCAAIAFVPGIGATASGALYWMLTPAMPAGETRVRASSDIARDRPSVVR
jgi:PAS domain S-box-containing protein